MDGVIDDRHPLGGIYLVRRFACVEVDVVYSRNDGGHRISTGVYAFLRLLWVCQGF